jgi:hypothetical protein
MTPGVTQEMVSALARDRSGLVHASTADRVTERRALAGAR